MQKMSGHGNSLASRIDATTIRHMTKREDELKHVAQVGLAISDPGRLRMLMALVGRSLCVCQMTELLGLAPSTVSKHLSILKAAGLVEETKKGRWVYHELCGHDCAGRPVVDWAKTLLANDAIVAEDEAKVKKILSVDCETLCKK